MNLVKREGASGLILTVLIWSVLSVLGTRLFLTITGNPIIGRGQWHIAHVLFGGVFMVSATISILIFEGNRIRHSMAMLFGIGWGLFVDELGKYVTRDNDYWFRPAIMMIYLSFVILFLIYKYLERWQSKSDRATFYTVLGQLEELAENDLETTEKTRLKTNLEKLKSSRDEKLEIMAAAIEKALFKIRAKNDRAKRGLGVIGRKILTTTYDRVFKRKMVMYGLWTYSIYYAVDKIIDALRIYASPQKMMMINRFYRDYDFFGKSDIYLIVFKIVFEVIASILFLLGARDFWFKKRTRGIRFFKYGLYVNILLASIFKFYFEQLGAVVDLLISVILLEILNEYRREVKSVS